MSQNKVFLYLSSVVCILLIVALYVASVIVQKSIKIETSSYLAEMNVQASHIVKNRLDGDFKAMRSLAIFIAEQSPCDNDMIFEILKLENINNNSKRMAIVSKDGLACTTDDIVLDLADRDFIQKAFAGKENFSKRILDKSDGQNILVLAVPIIHDEQVTAVLITTYNADILTNQLSVESFGGQGYSYLVDASGTILGASSKNTGSQIDNFIDELDFYPENKEVVEKLRTDLAQNKSGVIEYYYKGYRRYANFTPIIDKDVFIFSVVPESVVAQEAHKRLIFALALTGIILVCVAILVCYIFYSQNRMNKKLEDSYHTIMNDEKRFRAIIETTRLAVWEYDIIEHKVIYNKYLSSILGLFDEERVLDLLGENINIHPDEKTLVRDTLNSLEGDVSQAFEYRLLHQDGHWHWFRCILNVSERDAEGKVKKILAINIDIHEYKLSELARDEDLDELTFKVIATSSELENSQEMLAKQKDLLYKVLEITPIPVVIISDDLVIYSNSAMHNLLGPIIHLSVESLCINAQEYYDLKNIFIEEQSISNKQATLKDTLGNIKQVLLSIISFEYQGKAAELAWVLDISELMQTQKALELARIDAESANRAKSEFLANMSHEIRTPMNGVMGLTYLARHTEDLQTIYNHLAKIDASAKRLLMIINDILDYSKIEAGMLLIENIPMQLNEVVSTLVETLRLSAEDKQLDFIVDLDPTIPKRLLGDPVRLGQVLINIINNSIKFTSQGEVCLKVLLIKENDGIATIYFGVRDSGIGMDMQKFNTDIFHAFSQEDNSVTRKYGGTGLGLAISRNLVDKMGGRLQVESSKNVGSNFFFTLNFEIASDLADNLDEAIDKTLNDEQFFNKKILLVEDNEINQLIAFELLKEKGFEVDIANNGQEAVDKTMSKLYDLILMDIQMPEMDGLQATKIIREQTEYKKLPIIAMTAHAMSGDREKSIAAGMQEHITKPIDPAILLDVLHRYLCNNK